MGVAQAIIQVWLGTLFLYTGAHKALRPAETVRAVTNYRLVPDRRAALVARLTTALELITAAALLYLPRMLAGGVGAAILGAVFLVASGSALVRHIDTSCGCIGATNGRRVGIETPLRAAVILALGVALAATNAGSQLSVWAALAATLASIAPSIAGLLRARRSQRRQKLARARVLATIIADLAQESKDAAITTSPLISMEAIHQ